MKLEYNILWIDNDLKEYIDNGEVGSIEEYLVELGFEPKIVPVFDEAKVNDFLNINYDLIISDFNLNVENGDVIIYRLREDNKLDTEILFYSARTDFTDNKEVKDRLAFMERINIHFGRDTLFDKIEKVIELTVQKLLELNATRGLITAATSDLDVEIETLSISILRTHLKKGDDELEKIVQDFASNLSGRPARFVKHYEEVGFDSSFQSIEAHWKWRVFRDSLKELNKVAESQELTEILGVNKTYNDEVIAIRNKFAHAKAEEVDGKTVLKGQFGKEDFEYDLDACVKIRTDLIGHKRNIERLKNILAEL